MFAPGSSGGIPGARAACPLQLPRVQEQDFFSSFFFLFFPKKQIESQV